LKTDGYNQFRGPAKGVHAMKTALISIAVLLGVYLVSYLLLVERQVGSGFTSKGCIQFAYPTFRAGGEAAGRFYAPVLWLDERIRVRYWQGQD
jgi:hypothetical protein